MKKVIFLAILCLSSISYGALKCEHLYSIQTQFFLNQHIKKQTMHAALQAKTINNFIDGLDPAKIYLTKKQAEGLRKTMKNVFKETKNSRCISILRTYKSFLTLFDKRIEFLRKILKDPKFKLNKKISIVRKKKPKRATTVKASQNYHAKFLQIEIARRIDQEVTLKKARKLVENYYKRIYSLYQGRNTEAILSDYLQAFAKSLDPHSSYFSREEWNDFQVGLKLSFEGIGAHLSFDEMDGLTTIYSLVEGGAAEKGGSLKANDKIIAVAQGTKKGKEIPREKLKFDDVVGLELSEVVKKIKGPKGTSVHLRVLRKIKKKNKKLIVRVVRDKIELKNQHASVNYIKYIKSKKPEEQVKALKDLKSLKASQKKSLNEKNIAIIRLPSFYSHRNEVSASKDIKKILLKVKNTVDGVILDLTGNGGGVLTEAVKLSGLFFKKGNVVKQSQKSRSDIVLADTDSKTYFSGPLVVLIDQSSASASEIVAGALKDYKRALIVGGKQSFGKGTVQTLSIIPDPSPLKSPDVLGAAKTTIGMFYVPAGYSTQHIGVTPHITLPSPYDYFEDFLEKDKPSALPSEKSSPFLSPTAYDGSWKKVNSQLIKHLKKKSYTRVRKDKKFKEIIKEGNKYKKDLNETLSVQKSLDGSEKRLKNKKEEKSNRALTKTEKKAKSKKNYLERANLKEAIRILSDMIDYYSKSETVS